MDKIFGKYSALAKIVLLFLSITLFLFVAWLVYKSLEKAKIQKAIEDTTATVNVNGATMTVNVGTKAAEIFDALHGSLFYEDEVKAVNSVLTTPKTLVPLLSQTYYAISGNINLKQDLMNYLSAEQWLSIQSQFN